MWEGGVHGSHHEAAARLLPPWFGGPAAFSEPVGAAGVGGFGLPGSGGYSCDVVGQGGGMFGFGFEAAVAAAQQQQQQQQRAAEAAAAGSSKAVMSGLLGSLQAELGRMNAAGEIMDAKALAASRSHSEAERRRRQRINGHLARLRSLLPNTTKTDKASLLAEVLEHVKELKRQTSAMTMMAAAVEDEDAGPAQMLPTEADELGVDAAEDGEGRLVVRASLCCEDRPDLIPDIIRALAALRLHAHRAEITTLGGRVRSVLLITQNEGEDDDGRLLGDDVHDDECAASHRRHECIASVQEALRGVIDRRAACSNDTSSSGGGGGGGGSIKRQRMNYGAQEQCSV